MAQNNAKASYRRVRIRRPFYQTVTRVVAQPKLKPETKSEPAGSDTGKKAASEIASFEPDNNPYAFLLCCLPHMLGSIPDLVTWGNDTAQYRQTFEAQDDEDALAEMADTVPQIPSDQVFTPSHSNPLSVSFVEQQTGDNDWEAGRKVVFPLPPVVRQTPPETKVRKARRIVPDLPGELWLDRASPLDDSTLFEGLCRVQPARRAFLWPGLPELNCRQRRFGGDGEDRVKNKGRLQADTEGWPKVMTTLAECFELTPLSLLLRLSSPAEVARFIVNEPLSSSLKPMSEWPQLSLARVNTGQYLDGLLDSSAICGRPDWPMRLIQQGQPVASGLTVWPFEAGDDQSGMLVRLNHRQQSLWIEWFDGQALVFSPGRGLCHLPQATFVENLDKLSAELQHRLEYDVYRFSEPEISALHRQIADARKLWQRYLQMPLLQFVTLSSHDIVSTESSRHGHNKV